MEMVLVDNNIMIICCILIPIYSANVYTAYVFVYLTYTIVDHHIYVYVSV